MRFTTERVLPAPPARVAPYLMDHDKLPRWIPELVSSKPDDDKGPRVGGHYTQVWNFGGVQQEMKGEVTECEPPSRYAYVATVGKNEFRGRFELKEEEGGRTKLTYSEESKVGGFGGFLALFMKGAVRERTEASFANLQKLLEAGAASQATEQVGEPADNS